MQRTSFTTVVHNPAPSSKRAASLRAGRREAVEPGTPSRTLPRAQAILWLVAGTLLASASLQGQALSFPFDGQAQSATVADSSFLDIEGPLTLEAWVWADPGSVDEAFNFIVSKNLSGTGYALVTSGVGADKRFVFEANFTTGQPQVIGTSVPPVGKWVHVAGVWGDGIGKLYVDGILETEVAISEAPLANELDLMIGSSPFGRASNWQGQIDEVRIWKTARSQKELRNGFGVGWPGAGPGLVGSWRFEEGIGATSNDSSGNANHATLDHVLWGATAPLQEIDWTSRLSNVGEIVSPGAPGSVVGLCGLWTTLAAGDDDASLLSSFILAGHHGRGRVALAGHDGLLANPGELDNALLLDHLFDWLSDGGPPRNIGYTSGHGEFLNVGNLGALDAQLTTRGHAFAPLGSPLTSATLAGVDALLVGNAWGAFGAAEIDAIETWVLEGGGVFLVGLGWSWPNAFQLYPMVQIAERFGATWLRTIIEDPTDTLNGSPTLSSFYPDPPTHSLPAAKSTIATAFTDHPADLGAFLEVDGNLQRHFAMAHLLLAQLPTLFAEGSSTLTDLADFHRDLMLDPIVFATLKKSSTLPSTEPTLTWLRERFYRTWIENAPLDAVRAADIATIAAFPAAPEALLVEHGILLQDNTRSSVDQLAVVDRILDLVPSSLHDLAFISIRDYLEEPIPAGMKSSEYFAGSRSAVNLFSLDVGAASENPFPNDVAPWLADIFTSVMAHELNHVVDALTISGSPTLSARRADLIAAAGSDPLSYLRSMLPPGFFVAAPQEFFASISNQWLANSVRVFELAAARFDAGRAEPFNQALFFAEVYSQGGLSTWLYEADINGQIERTNAPLTRDVNGHIESIVAGDTAYHFTLDANGNVLAYQATPAQLAFRDDFELGNTSRWAVSLP